MRKLLVFTAAVCMSASAQAYEAPTYFAETMQIWDNEFFSNRDIKYEAKSAYIPEITWSQAIKGGWCNELVHYALLRTGQLQKIVDGTTVYNSEAINGFRTLRGRHLTDMRNSEVNTQEKLHNQIDLKVGDIALLDWDGNPDYWSSSYGIDHVSLYMGEADGLPGYGWFLGGNQNAHLQPKLYKLSQVTFNSRLKVDEGVTNTRFFANIEDGYIRIEKLDVEYDNGNFTLQNAYRFEEDDVYGMKFDQGFKGTNEAAFAENHELHGATNKQLWDDYGLQIQEVRNDTHNVYVMSNQELHVHNELIVTQEYKDTFSGTIADIIRDYTADNTPDSMKEKLRWVEAGEYNWNRRVWNKLKKQMKHNAFDSNPNAYKYYIQILNDNGLDGEKYLGKQHKYAAAINAVRVADESDDLSGANQTTDEGRERLDAWTDIVVDNVLDAGFVQDDYIYAQTFAKVLTPKKIK